MKTPLIAAVASCLGLGACASNGLAYHDAVHAQATAAYFNPTIGAGVGHLGVTVDKSANVDKNGNAIIVHGGCKDDSPDTFSNMNANATASANSVNQPLAAAVVGAATGTAGTVIAPQIAIAAGDVTGNGGAAIIAAASMTGNPADVIAAYCQNASLPAASPGQIVRAGVAPK